MPAIVAIPVGIALYDLGPNLGHNWCHTVPWFWRFHSLHHSAPRLSVINAARGHPIDYLIMLVIGAPIPILIGVPADIAAWYSALGFYGGILSHANIRMQCGIFNYVLNTPELHRWHHSPFQRETDTNYGTITVVWDHVFRSYYKPKRSPRRDVELDFPVSAELLEQLVQPLTPAGHRPERSAIRDHDDGGFVGEFASRCIESDARFEQWPITRRGESGHE